MARIRGAGRDTADDGLLYPSRSSSAAARSGCAAIAEPHGLSRWTTSWTRCSRPEVDVYFDTQVTSARESALNRAMRPASTSTRKSRGRSAAAAFALAGRRGRRAITHGVVQDKLFLPGMIKLRRLIRGLFGRVLSVRLESATGCSRDGFPRSALMDYRRKRARIVLDISALGVS